MLWEEIHADPYHGFISSVSVLLKRSLTLPSTIDFLQPLHHLMTREEIKHFFGEDELSSGMIIILSTYPTYLWLKSMFSISISTKMSNNPLAVQCEVSIFFFFFFFFFSIC